ncbi:SRPBCC family protein [Urechidicola croceus]|uniref:ATPase n=1 Tax=Urechidicola croceus TaxID=1850246 RepID=A0A1D8P640_9FLAO|nr:SRPBCC domain-containing protein [Urechidicola croceus]AOW20017.1 ATPase [Urechidicola croceus]
MFNSSKPIVVEQLFDNSIQEVWNAISNLSLMKLWFFEQIEDFKPEVGFKTSFVVKVEDRTYTHLWELTEIILQKNITYDWKYAEYDGEGKVIFELFDLGDKTKLVLTNFGIESFPSTIPEFSRESCNNGWNYFIKERLYNFLNK